LNFVGDACPTSQKRERRDEGKGRNPFLSFSISSLSRRSEDGLGGSAERLSKQEVAARRSAPTGAAQVYWSEESVIVVLAFRSNDALPHGDMKELLIAPAFILMTDPGSENGRMTSISEKARVSRQTTASCHPDGQIREFTSLLILFLLLSTSGFFSRPSLNWSARDRRH